VRDFSLTRLELEAATFDRQITRQVQVQINEAGAGGFDVLRNATGFMTAEVFDNDVVNDERWSEHLLPYARNAAVSAGLNRHDRVEPGTRQHTRILILEVKSVGPAPCIGTRRRVWP
jgi:hypothetical protein